MQTVLKEMRKYGLYVVALHNHMIGEEPNYYFTHYWGKGFVEEMAKSFKAALKSQEEIQRKK
ncbi:MAG: DUF1259 domain-containing protein [Thermodesulfobacteriota bacterium]